MSSNISIPCPVCSTKIPVDTHKLISGEKFNCPKCEAQIGLSTESKPSVEESFEKFKKLRDM